MAALEKDSTETWRIDSDAHDSLISQIFGNIVNRFLAKSWMTRWIFLLSFQRDRD